MSGKREITDPTVEQLHAAIENLCTHADVNGWEVCLAVRPYGWRLFLRTGAHIGMRGDGQTTTVHDLAKDPDQAVVCFRVPDVKNSNAVHLLCWEILAVMRHGRADLRSGFARPGTVFQVDSEVKP